MMITQTTLPGVLLIEPRVHRDARGSFAEFWRADRYQELGINDEFVQDNVSWSQRGVLRGLHYQTPNAQAKLITALYGAIYDVAVDVRPEADTFGKWVAVELTADTMKQLYIPAGFAHGFLVLSDHAIVSYKCSDYYVPEHEYTLRWNDPRVGIDWPISNPVLSDRDARAPFLTDVAAEPPASK